MNKHVQLVRTISSVSPELAEQLISAWGTPQLHVIVRDIRSGKDKRLFSYLSSDMLRQFADLEDDHRQQFPDIAAAEEAKVPQALVLDQSYLLVKGSFPHVADSICRKWGSRDLESYMGDLFVDARAARRQGFPEDIKAALVDIHRKHQQLFPLYAHSTESRPTISQEEWIRIPGN